jgi:hypothetical protein
MTTPEGVFSGVSALTARRVERYPLRALERTKQRHKVPRSTTST